MIVKTQILNRIAKALLGSTPESGDQDMPLRSLNLVAQVCEPMRIDGLIGAALIVNTSLIREQYILQTNTVGAQTIIGTLGVGCWDISVHCCYGSNYTSVSASPDARVIMKPLSGIVTSGIMDFFATGLAAATQNQSQTGRFLMTLDDPGGTQFLIDTVTNGAGQTQKLAVVIIANKIL